MDSKDISTLHASCIRFMPLVTQYNHTFLSLGEWWQKVTLIGKINSHSVTPTLIDDMETTRRHFKELQSNLINNLVKENIRKLELECSARAQVAIDILIRNLFERTADVGFLATDDDIRAFLRESSPTEQQQSAIVERLRHYTDKYSVYDEIVILDPQGRVRANLDQTNQVASSNDPLIRETLEATQPYVETFRRSDIQSGRRAAHIFSAPIRDDDQHGGAVLGVLCLCFRFEDEVNGIFANLVSDDEMIAILDQHNRVISSSNEQILPFGYRVSGSGQRGINFIELDEQYYLSHQNKTKGYQGYNGLNWLGVIMRPVQKAFAEKSATTKNDAVQLQRSSIFSQTLQNIAYHAERVVDDLSLVVLNGQIVSAKRNAIEFMPVLEEIRTIGYRTKGVFDESINDLCNTVVSSLLSDVQFQAFLAVDIMDRNLYERANDVRWWALTSRFREILAQPGRSHQDDATLAEVLQYINGLYTVYTDLMVFDTNGTIIAVSNLEENHLIGQPMPDHDVMKKALAISDSKHYTVSPFAATPLYNGRHTYLYLSSIRAPDNHKIVGGICVVFDAQPEFMAMLQDALPRDSSQQVLSGAFGLFTDRHGQIIASTNPELLPGQTLLLESHFFELENGGRGSVILEYNGDQYAVGAAMSKGYREYKTTGDYKNDVLALIFVPV
ncbi:cache domain-containing protein [Methylophaga sp.]|uniref:cache domain-containing protein n=1 Tax=Methylophaga sp. TaxID=2024840 RepID=UPI00271C88E7|nr:cache domain-containing protein [Methylophaga sp.]MDO8826311.1 cache domain-containing protein [Methylophaga sp.]